MRYAQLHFQCWGSIMCTGCAESYHRTRQHSQVRSRPSIRRPCECRDTVWLMLQQIARLRTGVAVTQQTGVGLCMSTSVMS